MYTYRSSRGRIKLTKGQENRVGMPSTSSSMQQRDVTEDGNVSSPDSSAPPSPVPISGSMRRRDNAISKEKAKFFRQSAAFNARGVNGRGSGVPKVNAPANKRLSSSSSDSSSSSSSSSSGRSRSSSSSSSTSSSSSNSSNSSSGSSSSSAYACSLSVVRPSRPVFPLPKCLAARNADFTKNPTSMSSKRCSSSVLKSAQSSKKNEHRLKRINEKIQCPSEMQKIDKNLDQSKAPPKVLLRAPKLIAKVHSSLPKIFPLSHSTSLDSDCPISLFKKLLTDTSTDPWGFAALAAKAPIVLDNKPEVSNNKKDKPIAGFIQLKGLYDGLSHFYSTPLQSRTRPRNEKDSKPVISKSDPKVACTDKDIKILDKQQSPSSLIKSAITSKLMETREVAGSKGEKKLDNINNSLDNSPSAFRDRLSVPTIRPVTRSGKQVPYKILLVFAS